MLPLSYQGSLNESRIYQEGRQIFGIAEFHVNFLSSNLNPFDIWYNWIINNNEDSSKKSNISPTNEPILRINTNFLTKDNNTISLEIKNQKNHSDTAKLIYYYMKPETPNSGNCIIDPKNGTSMTTNFTFNASNWNSRYNPLQYRFYLLTETNTEITLNNISTSSVYISNKIPPGNRFFVEVIDSIGTILKESCMVNVIFSSFTLNSQLDENLSPNEKLKIFNYYTLNNSLKVNETENVLKIMDKILNNSNPIDLNTMNSLLTQMNSISTNSITILPKNSQLSLINIVENIVKVSNNFIQSENLVLNIYNILDNLLNDADFSNKIQNDNVNNSIYNDINLMISDLNKNVINSLVPGMVKSINLNNIQIEISKLSLFETSDYSFDDDTSQVGRRILTRKLLSKQDNCSSSSIFCLPKAQIESINRLNKGKALSIEIQYNKRNSFPLPLKNNQYIFSKDSINVSLYSYQINDIYHPNRMLSNRNDSLIKLSQNIYNENNSFIYKSVLNMNKNLSTVDKKLIDSSLCYQYDGLLNPLKDSCQVWYDYVEDKIICQCQALGMTINILDDTLSYLNILKQFPFTDESKSINL